MSARDTHPARAPLRRWAAGGLAVELLPAQPYAARYTPEQSVVGLAFEPQSGRHAFGSDRARAFSAQANGLAHVPAGCDVYSESPQGGEYLRLTFAARSGSDHVRAFSNLPDPIALKAARALRRALLSAATDPIAFEAPADKLIERVATHLEGAPTDAAARWMTPRRLSRAVDWAEAHLHAPVSIADWAGALDLSVRFFSRAFRAALAQSPHDYLIDRRIARARREIAAGAPSLAAIAAGAGFASHAHMSAVFKARLGAPPRAFRDLAGPLRYG